MSEFIMFILGGGFGWCLSVRFATSWKPIWIVEERPFSEENKVELGNER